MISGIAFALMLFIGVPVALCLCVTAIIFLYVADMTVLYESYPTQLFDGGSSYGLLAIPMFILIGELMNGGGITKRIISMTMAFIGSVKGGLAYVNLLANMFMSSIMGSAAAQVAVMSRVMVPEMERAGYQKNFAVGLTVYGGLLGPIIPPSIMFVIYSVLARLSVSDMLITGVIPGLMLFTGFVVLIAILGLFYPYPVTERRPLPERMKVILSGLPTLAIPIFIIGSIMTGIANPTEAAAIGVVISGLVGFLWTKDLKLADIPVMLIRAGAYSAIILFLVSAAGVFSWVLTYGNVPQQVASWITGIAHSPLAFMLLLVAVLLLVGTMIDGAPALIMIVPILLPIAMETYGINPYHFGVIAVLTLVLAFMTPPVGLCLYVASAICNMSPLRVFRATLPYFFVSLIVVLILAIFPKLSTFIL